METQPLNRQVALYIEAAKKFGINYTIIHPSGLVRFSKNGKNTRIYKSQVEANNAVATLLARNKYHTNRLLAKAKLPVAKLSFCRTVRDARKAAESIGYPVVLKPTKGSRGHHTVLEIKGEKELAQTVRMIRKVNHTFLIEKFHLGNDFRFLVLSNEVIGIVKRLPPTVTGDGIQTLQQLIRNLPRVKMDNEVRKALRQQGLTLSSILPNGKVISVRRNANYSTGGTAETVNKSQIHPEILKLSVKAAQTIGTTLAGVDMLIKDPKAPPKDGTVIIEVNSKPSIVIHHHPSRGKPQPVAETILKYLLHL